MPFDLKAGIVRILAADGKTTTGTGFVLSEKGIIATCSHVIQPEKLQVRGYPKPEKVEVIFRVNGQRGAARLLPQAWRAAEAEDVALMQLDGPLPSGVVPLTIGSSDGAAGHDFQTFGFPDQSPDEGIYGEGRLQDETSILGIIVQQVKSQEITPGFSGAPVFDKEARRVVGMVTSIATPDKFGRLAETAFITPAETLISIYPELVPSDVRPYMGLSPFTEKDAEFFFGRRRLVEGLEEALRSRPRFLLVMGPSGSGKSSVVQAGLIPQLRRGSVPGSDRWGIIVARPADRPFDMLERAGLKGAFAGLANAARGWLSRNPGKEKLLIILDQFEEFLVTCPFDLRRKFWSGLEDLLDSDIEVSVIAVMRDDFYSRFADDAPAAALAWTQRGFFQVGSNLEYEELREIIQQPARRVGLYLEEGLTEVIINDVLESSREGCARAGRSTVLPLLEFALTQLWERRDQGLLTHQAYQAIGKVTGSLTSWADQVCRGLEKEGLGPVARRIFTDLVNLGDERQRLPDSRRQRRIVDFLHDENDENEREAVGKVVQKLADARLVTTSLDKGEETVQIIHDSLIREWARLQRWLKKDRSFLAWERELEKDAREWRDTSPSDIAGRDEGRLLRGRRLEEAERWQKERERDLGEAERVFIEASLGLREMEREKEERAKAEKERTRRRNMAVLSFIAIIALLFAGIAYQQKGQADAKTNEALARSLASQSEQMRGVTGSLTESVLLAVESLRHKETQEGIAALQRSLYLLPKCIAYIDWIYSANAVAFNLNGRRIAIGCSDGSVRLWDIDSDKEVLRLKHNDSINAVSFSPDGKILATSGDDNTTRLWDINSGKEMLRQENNDSVNALAFSPDGKILADVSDNGTMCLLNVENKSELLKVHGKNISAAVFSPNGNMLAVGSSYRIYLWDIETWAPLLSLENDDAVRAIAFSPDGSVLATGSGGAVRLLDVSSGKEMLRLKHDQWVTAVAFSPDGNRLATASYDSTARLWDANTGKELERLDHDFPVESIAISPDGGELATGSIDGARLWDVEKGKLQQRLEHNNSISAIAFSPDGSRLATSSYDGITQLLNVETGNVLHSLKLSGLVHDMVFSPDGSRLAMESYNKICLMDAETGRVLHNLVTNDSVGNMIFSSNGRMLAVAYDDEIQLWDVQNGFKLHNMRHDDLQVLAFSPDGFLLASGSGSLKSGDNTAILWDVESGANVLKLEHKYQVLALAFSPDGSKLATGSIDMVGLWDVKRGKMQKKLELDEPVEAVAFSPDGRILATGSWDKTARLWDAQAGKELLRLDHDGQVNAVAFSPDGSRLATGSDDRTARLWDIKSGEELQRLENDDVVNAVAFSPDGSILETRTKDGTAHIWILLAKNITEEACSRITQNMTREEWKRFMDDPYSDCLTCPAEGRFNQNSIWPWAQGECQPCIGDLGELR